MRIHGMHLVGKAPRNLRSQVVAHEAGRGACGVLRRRALEARESGAVSAQGRRAQGIRFALWIISWLCAGGATGLVLIAIARLL